MLTDDSDARKGIPLFRGLLRYFPDACCEVAKLSMVGSVKHNGPDAPLHWDRTKSTDHADCIVRHLIDSGAVDTDGILHDVKAAWRSMALAQLAIEKLRKHQAEQEKIAALGLAAD